MCSIEEAWAGQTFDNKPVISQSDNKPNLIIAPNQQIGTIKLFDKNIQRYTKQFVDVKKHAKSNNVNLFEKNTIDTIMSLVLKD